MKSTDKMIDDFAVLRICTAYESGVGKGLSDPTAPNGHRAEDPEYHAFEIGRSEGEDMKARKQSDTDLLITQRDHLLAENDAGRQQYSELKGERASVFALLKNEQSTVDHHAALIARLMAENNRLIPVVIAAFLAVEWAHENDQQTGMPGLQDTNRFLALMDAVDAYHAITGASANAS